MSAGENWGEMAATECGEIPLPRGVCRPLSPDLWLTHHIRGGIIG